VKIDRTQRSRMQAQHVNNKCLKRMSGSLLIVATEKQHMLTLSQEAAMSIGHATKKNESKSLVREATLHSISSHEVIHVGQQATLHSGKGDNAGWHSSVRSCLELGGRPEDISSASTSFSESGSLSVRLRQSWQRPSRLASI